MKPIYLKIALIKSNDLHNLTRYSIFGVQKVSHHIVLESITNECADILDT